jgi:hypothetical protein
VFEVQKHCSPSWNTDCLAFHPRKCHTLCHRRARSAQQIRASWHVVRWALWTINPCLELINREPIRQNNRAIILEETCSRYQISAVSDKAGCDLPYSSETAYVKLDQYVPASGSRRIQHENVDETIHPRLRVSGAYDRWHRISVIHQTLGCHAGGMQYDFSWSWSTASHWYGQYLEIHCAHRQRHTENPSIRYNTGM